jgi:hypothetical protein
MRRIEECMEALAEGMRMQMQTGDEVTSRRAKARFIQYYPEMVKDTEQALQMVNGMKVLDQKKIV